MKRAVLVPLVVEFECAVVERSICQNPCSEQEHADFDAARERYERAFGRLVGLAEDVCGRESGGWVCIQPAGHRCPDCSSVGIDAGDPS